MAHGAIAAKLRAPHNLPHTDRATTVSSGCRTPRGLRGSITPARARQCGPPRDRAVVQQAKELLKKHGHQRALRSLDALQVATFAIVRAREEAAFVCADGRLCEIVKAEGHSALNPEEPVA